MSTRHAFSSPSKAFVLRILFGFIFLALLESQAHTATNRPIIIVFIADDFGWDDYGYGNPAARTPSIDSLTRRGRRYSQAVLTASGCSPSCSSIITGCYPHNRGPTTEFHLPSSPNRKVALDRGNPARRIKSTLQPPAKAAGKPADPIPPQKTPLS
jgi:hypothetical protein